LSFPVPRNTASRQHSRGAFFGQINQNSEDSVRFPGFNRTRSCHEYIEDFVGNWDDVIGWDGREHRESRFFHRILGA
jgi:hypothetical protein